jgi:uncharacterized protein (DUF2267 family)
VVREITAFLEIFAALRGKIDLERISKILKDFSKDLLMYFKSSVIMFQIMERYNTLLK